MVEYKEIDILWPMVEKMLQSEPVDKYDNKVYGTLDGSLIEVAVTSKGVIDWVLVVNAECSAKVLEELNGRLKRLKNLSALVPCYDCGGAGGFEQIVCTEPASNCCGGCNVNTKCEVCDGSGDIDQSEAFEGEIEHINIWLDDFKGMMDTLGINPEFYKRELVKLIEEL